MAKIKIAKPNDSGEYYETTITCETFNFLESSVNHDRTALDPIQSGLEKWWRSILSPKATYGRYGRYRGFNKQFNHLVMINGCPVLLAREGIRYEVNGKSYNLANVSAALARLTFKSCFEKEPAKLLSALYSTLSLPENVKYCLENKVPYHWFELLTEGEIKVRLNCQQISDNEIAIEVSDGVWGTMTVKQLDVFCNFYKNGKNRGSWVDTSPLELYYKTVGKEPSISEIEVMKAFLKQNRTSDLVERRAIELVNELLEQYPDRLIAEWNGNDLESIVVKGKDYDWKLSNNKYKSEIQMVSTYVWQPVIEKQAIGVDENDNTIFEKKHSLPTWQGPICIDNMAKGSSLGDQFAARALALLNDRFTITIVNTIKRYLIANPNEYRVDTNVSKNM
jgi:hypothetical protein